MTLRDLLLILQEREDDLDEPIEVVLASVIPTLIQLPIQEELNV